MGRYDEKDAAKDTGSSASNAKEAWRQAERDDARGSSGKTLDEAVPVSREEVSVEDLAEIEEGENG